MDRYEVSPFGGSVPPAPSPPVALSDLLAQRPFPTYTPTYERPVTSPDTTFGAADEHSILVVASGDGTQASPGHRDQRENLVPDSKLEAQAGPSSQPPADSSDWLATRNQLRPSRNQGTKGDWIRGWSEGVGVYGSETYCACSESSFVGDPSLVVKGGEIKSGVRSIWLKGKRPLPTSVNGSAQPSPSASDPEVCRNCSRMPSPPTSAAGSLKDGAEEPHRKINFAQKFNSFLQRAKPRRGQDTYKKFLASTKHQSALSAALNRSARSDAAVNIPRGFSDPSQLRNHRRDHPSSHGQNPKDGLSGSPNGVAAMPDKKPTSPDAKSALNPGGAAQIAAKQNNADNSRSPPSPTATRAAGGSSSLNLSASDDLRGDAALARRMSRLQRAQALLDRKRDE